MTNWGNCTQYTVDCDSRHDIVTAPAETNGLIVWWCKNLKVQCWIWWIRNCVNGERKWRSYSSSVTWSWRSWISEASWQWWWNYVGRILVKASRHLSLDLKTLLRQFQRSDKKLTWDCAHQDSEHDGVHKTSNHKSEKLQKQVINNNGVSNQRTTAESWFNSDDADISLCEEWEVKSFPQVSPNTAPFVRRKEVDVDCTSRLSQATKFPLRIYSYWKWTQNSEASLRYLLKLLTLSIFHVDICHLSKR